MDSNYAYPINIGNDDEVTINEIATIILKIMRSKSKIVYNKMPEDDPLRRKPNLSLAKKILNWTPKICKEEGIELLVKYYNENKII